MSQQYYSICNVCSKWSAYFCIVCLNSTEITKYAYYLTMAKPVQEMRLIRSNGTSITPGAFSGHTMYNWFPL